MKIAAITREGLAAIAVLVALLWGCLGGERLYVRQANRNLENVILKRTAAPMKRFWRARHYKT
jgi:hypothetical protein